MQWPSHNDQEPGHRPGEMSARIAGLNGSEFARLLGMEIVEARPGYARVTMQTPGKRNQNGTAHGGAVFSLADQAFAAAANAGEEQRVALSARISYLSPASGTLTAIAEYTGESRDHSIYCVHVYDGDRLIATFEGIGIHIGEWRK